MMPTVKDFDGRKITIYADDHNPPHFHLLAPDWRATFEIKGCQLLSGEYKSKEAKDALAWAKENEETLLAIWTELNERDDQGEKED